MVHVGQLSDVQNKPFQTADSRPSPCIMAQHALCLIGPICGFPAWLQNPFVHDNFEVGQTSRKAFRAFPISQRPQDSCLTRAGSSALLLFVIFARCDCMRANTGSHTACISLCSPCRMRPSRRYENGKPAHAHKKGRLQMLARPSSRKRPRTASTCSSMQTAEAPAKQGAETKTK